MMDSDGASLGPTSAMQALWFRVSQQNRIYMVASHHIQDKQPVASFIAGGVGWWPVADLPAPLGVHMVLRIFQQRSVPLCPGVVLPPIVLKWPAYGSMRHKTSFPAGCVASGRAKGHDDARDMHVAAWPLV